MQKFQFLNYVHPFFIGLYPIISVFGTISGFTLADIFRSFVVIIVITGIVLSLGWKFQKLNKVSIALSFFYLWFFCYFIAHNFLILPIAWVSYGLPIFYLIVFIIGIVLIVKTQRNLEVLNKIFSFFAIVLIGLSLFPILVGAVGIQETPHPIINTRIDDNDCYNTNRTHKPDIYIILLDSYAGIEEQKILFKDINTQNLERFQQQGFKILNYHSNYDLTVTSMDSLFNMNYVSDTTKSPDFKNLEVLRILKQFNYTTVHVKMGYWELENSWKTDYEYTPGLFNTFEITLLDRSYLGIPLHLFNKYQQINSIVTLTPLIVDISGPKLVYMHIDFPHPYYILNKDGTPSYTLPTPYYVNNKYAYLTEVEGTSAFTEKIVSTILKDSKDEPIIIVLGDHGPRLSGESGTPNEYSALFAYSLPSYIHDPFYDNMTTVNVFRTLLPSTIGCNYTRLPDHF